jgi:hypothetical protein
MILAVWALTVLLLLAWGFNLLEVIGLMVLLHFGAVLINRVLLALIVRRLASK